MDKIRNLFLSLVVLLLAGQVATAQLNSWIGSPKKDDAENAHTIYREALKAKQYDVAFENWQIAYDIAPTADGKRDYHFIDGVKLYIQKYSTETDADKKVLRFVEENPASSKKNKAYFNVGNYYFSNKKAAPRSDAGSRTTETKGRKEKPNSNVSANNTQKRTTNYANPRSEKQTRPTAKTTKYSKPSSSNTSQHRGTPKYSKPKSYESLPSRQPRSSKEYVRPKNTSKKSTENIQISLFGLVADKKLGLSIYLLLNAKANPKIIATPARSAKNEITIYVVPW